MQALTRVPGLRLAYLFGSRARGGAATAASDADVAVLVEPPLSAEAFGLLVEALSTAAGVEVDLVELHAAPPLLRLQVISAGDRLVVRNDDERTAFEARAMLEFMDTQHLRDLQHQYLRERAGAGRVP